MIIYAHRATTAHHGLIVVAGKLPIWRPWRMQTLTTTTAFCLYPMVCICTLFQCAWL